MPSSLEALRWAGLQRGSRCLDLGCGDGLATQALARAVGRVGRVVGLDANPNVVDAAGKTAAELHDDDAWARVAFVCGHVPDHLEALKGQRFDFVYTRLLLSGLAQPETAVECARSLLWPGGRLLVEDFDYGSAFCHPHSADFDRFTQLQSGTSVRFQKKNTRLSRFFFFRFFFFPLSVAYYRSLISLRSFSFFGLSWLFHSFLFVRSRSLSIFPSCLSLPSASPLTPLLSFLSLSSSVCMFPRRSLLLALILNDALIPRPPFVPRSRCVCGAGWTATDRPASVLAAARRRF